LKNALADNPPIFNFDIRAQWTDVLAGRVAILRYRETLAPLIDELSVRQCAQLSAFVIGDPKWGAMVFAKGASSVVASARCRRRGARGQHDHARGDDARHAARGRRSQGHARRVRRVGCM